MYSTFAVTLAFIRQQRFLKLRNTTLLDRLHWLFRGDFRGKVLIIFSSSASVCAYFGGWWSRLRSAHALRAALVALKQKTRRCQGNAHAGRIVPRFTNNWTCLAHRYPHQSLQKIAVNWCMRCSSTEGEQNTDRNSERRCASAWYIQVNGLLIGFASLVGLDKAELLTLTPRARAVFWSHEKAVVCCVCYGCDEN